MKTSDFLVINLAEELEEGTTLVQGTSTFLPLVATVLAMKKKKINLIAGFYLNPKINPKVPSTFCFENYSDGKISGLSEFLEMLIGKKIDLEFLRPAQVDKFGNINNTCIGNFKFPKIRLPGGMGIDDVVHFARKSVLYVPDHSKKVFVDKVDFVTASGWDKGKGPDKIISNMCVFEFIDKKITLTKINPSYKIANVIENTNFKFDVARPVRNMLLVDEKNEEEIKKIDPLAIRDLEIKEEKDEVLKKLI